MDQYFQFIFKQLDNNVDIGDLIIPQNHMNMAIASESSPSRSHTIAERKKGEGSREKKQKFFDFTYLKNLTDVSA